jgi:hypothetical protein
MGRNDNSSMVSISMYGIIMSKFLLIALFLVSASVLMQADEKKKVVRKYKFRVDRPVKSDIIYQMTDESIVERTYSDGQTMDYHRKVDYFFSQKVFGDPKNNLLNVTYSIDSVRYYFKDGPKVVRVNTAADENNASTFEDFKVVSPSIGRKFDFVYSEYGDIANVESEQFDELLIELNKESMARALGEVGKHLWITGIGDSRLRQVCDVPKIMMMKEKKELDSTWESPLYFEVNFLEFFAKPDCRIADYKNGKYVFDAVFDKSQFNDKSYYFFKTGSLCKIEDAEADGAAIIYFDKFGLLDRMEMNVEATVKASVGKEVFTEKIKSNQTWQALKKYGM